MHFFKNYCQRGLPTYLPLNHYPKDVLCYLSFHFHKDLNTSLRCCAGDSVQMGVCVAGGRGVSGKTRAGNQVWIACLLLLPDITLGT